MACTKDKLISKVIRNVWEGMRRSLQPLHWGNEENKKKSIQMSFLSSEASFCRNAWEHQGNNTWMEATIWAPRWPITSLQGLCVVFVHVHTRGWAWLCHGGVTHLPAGNAALTGQPQLQASPTPGKTQESKKERLAGWVTKSKQQQVSDGALCSPSYVFKTLTLLFREHWPRSTLMKLLA